MRWAGHVARMGTGELHTGFWWGNVYKEATCKTWHGWAYTIGMDLPIGGYELETGFICFGTEQVAGACECVNEPKGSIKCGEFLE